MKFGIFHELSVAKPWHARSEYDVYHNALEQVELADELGFDQAWAVEHHFLEEYSHSSAPEVFLAAVSQRTRNIRLGHGIIQTSPLYNHPARTAERIATLEQISTSAPQPGPWRVWLKSSSRTNKSNRGEGATPQAKAPRRAERDLSPRTAEIRP